jgi:hypothetical protein
MTRKRWRYLSFIIKAKELSREKLLALEGTIKFRSIESAKGWLKTADEGSFKP